MSRYSPSDEGELSPVSVEPYSKERKLSQMDGEDFEPNEGDDAQVRKHRRRSKEKSKRKRKSKSQSHSHHKRNHHHPPEGDSRGRPGV